MADRDAIGARLTRAGLDEEQVEEAFVENAADLDGFQKWLEAVHDNDIKERYGEAEEAEGDDDATGSGDDDATGSGDANG